MQIPKSSTTWARIILTAQAKSAVREAEKKMDADGDDCFVGDSINLMRNRNFSALTAAGSLDGAYLSYLSAEKGEPQIVTPPIVDYADAVQDLAADELERLGPPCARDVVLADRSALARFVTDYGVLRDKIRAAKE